MVFMSKFYNLDVRKPILEEDILKWVKNFKMSKFPVDRLDENNCYVLDIDLVSRLILQYAQVRHTVISLNYDWFRKLRRPYDSYPLLITPVKIMPIKIVITKEQAVKFLKEDTSPILYNSLFNDVIEKGLLFEKGTPILNEGMDIEAKLKFFIPRNNTYYGELQGHRLERNVAEVILGKELDYEGN